MLAAREGRATAQHLTLRTGPPESGRASRSWRVLPPWRRLLPQRRFAAEAVGVACDGLMAPLSGIRQRTARRHRPLHAPGEEGIWHRRKLDLHHLTLFFSP